MMKGMSIAAKKLLLDQLQKEKEKELHSATLIQRQQLRFDQKKAGKLVEDTDQMNRILNIAKNESSSYNQVKPLVETDAEGSI